MEMETASKRLVFFPFRTAAIPSQHWKCRTVRNSLKRIKLPCDLLGVAPVLPSGDAAPVTQHVTRNTFITPASADGAKEQ